MSPDTRVSVMPFGDGYFGVVHRAGEPDEIIDGADGKPQRFNTAGEAMREARRAAGLSTDVATVDLGVEDWKRQRAAAYAAEAARVSGSDPVRTRSGRQVVVVRKRRAI